MLKFEEGMRSIFMARKKLFVDGDISNTIRQVWDLYTTSQAAKGVCDITLRNYKQHFHSISKFLDVERSIDDLTKGDLELMVVEMRKNGLATNSVATYVRRMRAFLNWCNQEGYCSLSMANIREQDTVKETYSDAELERLLKKPKKHCDFCEYRSWVIVNFLLNSGCRAATVRNIQNRDVDLDARQVVFRHTKSKKVQVIPLCSYMALILRDYMAIRKGKPDDYLFCDQFGGMLSETALRQSVARYNRRRGVAKTSLHMFRHTFARKYLVDCGGDAFTLQRLMGHSTLKMTKHYCSIFDADIAKNYDRFSPLANIQKPRETIKNI